MNLFLKYILALLLTTMLAFVTIFFVENNEKRIQENSLRQFAEKYSDDLQKDIDKSISVLLGLKYHFEDETFIDKKEFSRLTKTILYSNNFLKGLSYNKYLKNSDRQKFELWNKQYNSDQYKITQKGKNGFEDRDIDSVYVVVQYIEPYLSNKKALGYDINSNAARKKTINKAIATKKIRITEPISLVQTGIENNGLLALNPVFSKDSLIDGFFVGVFDVKKLIKKAVRNDSLMIRISDITDDPIIMFDRAGVNADTKYSVSRSLNVMGRVWLCDFFFEISPKGNLSRLVIVIIFSLVYVLMFVLIYFEHKMEYNFHKIEKASSQIELLLKEVHHRVKNNLQVVNSLIGLEKSRANNEETIDVLQKTQSRIGSMSNLHELLYENKDFKNIHVDVYVMRLVEYVLSSMSRDQIKCNIDVDKDVVLEIDKLLSLGLLMNELITNSIKHGFNGVAHPMVTIKLIRENSNYFFEYKDNGVGINKDDLKLGLGSKLIVRLVKQLKGDIDDSSSSKIGYCLKFRF